MKLISWKKTGAGPASSARPKSVIENVSEAQCPSPPRLLLLLVIITLIVVVRILDFERAEGRGYTGYIITDET